MDGCPWMGVLIHILCGQLSNLTIPYSGKVWRGESLVNLANRRQFAKLKPSKLIPTIDNPLADPFIRQTLKNSRFAKHSARQTFPLYSITKYDLLCVPSPYPSLFSTEHINSSIGLLCKSLSGIFPY